LLGMLHCRVRHVNPTPYWDLFIGRSICPSVAHSHKQSVFVLLLPYHTIPYRTSNLEQHHVLLFSTTTATTTPTTHLPR
jgi:hypothetical protein